MYSIDSLEVSGVKYALRDYNIRNDITRSQTSELSNVMIRLDDVQVHTPIYLRSIQNNLLSVLNEQRTLVGDAGGQVVVDSDGGIKCSGRWTSNMSSRSFFKLFELSRSDITETITFSFDKVMSSSTNVCAELVVWAEEEGFEYDWGYYYVDAVQPVITLNPETFSPYVTSVYAYVSTKDYTQDMSGTAYFQLEYGSAATAYVQPGTRAGVNTFWTIAGKNLIDVQTAELTTRDRDGRVSSTLVERADGGLLWKTGSTYYVRITCNIPRGLRISGSWKSTGVGDNRTKLMRVEYDDGTYVQIPSTGLNTTRTVTAIYIYKENVATPLTEDVYISEIQVEVGSKVTAYEPYRTLVAVRAAVESSTGEAYISADDVVYENCVLYIAQSTRFKGYASYQESIASRIDKLTARVAALEKAILSI